MIKNVLQEMTDRPLIHHCNNCKWCVGSYCIVRFNYIDFPRLRGLTC